MGVCEMCGSVLGVLLYTFGWLQKKKSIFFGNEKTSLHKFFNGIDVCKKDSTFNVCVI